MRSEDKIHSPEFSQPICTILQLALVDLLRSFKVTPVIVTGHSSGEIAAAYAIGALSQESACKVAYHRGQVAEKIRIASKGRPGAMISVNLTEAELAVHLEQLAISQNTVCVACVNSSANLTLAGPFDAIDALKKQLDQCGIFAHQVNTGIAYHSPAMMAVADEYSKLLGDLGKGSDIAQRTSMISSVTGHVVSVEELTKSQYWVENLTSPVKFSDAMNYLGDLGHSNKRPPFISGTITDLIEIGPHSALRRPIRDTLPSMRYHSLLDRKEAPLISVLKTLGLLFCHGHPTSVLCGNGQATKAVPCLTDCPPYPFDRSRRYWAESRLSKDYRLRQQVSGHVLGRQSYDWNPLQPRWRNWMCTETMPWLADHAVSIVTSRNVHVLSHSSADTKQHVNIRTQNFLVSKLVSKRGFEHIGAFRYRCSPSLCRSTMW